MGKIALGTAKFNNTIAFGGPAPLDDRLACESVSDLYVDPTSTGDKGAYYGFGYKGMTVSVVNGGNVEVYVLKNDVPYTTENKEIIVDENNFSTYWLKMADENSVSGMVVWEDLL